MKNAYRRLERKLHRKKMQNVSHFPFLMYLVILFTPFLKKKHH